MARQDGWLGLASPVLALVLGAAMALAGPVAASGMSGERKNCADVALVLAIDASGSIDPKDFALQMQGYAAAFRSAQVQASLRAAGQVDVAVVIWADSAPRSDILPFRRLTVAEDAQALARDLERFPRLEGRGMTGLARALKTSLDLLLAPEVCAERRIIDLSGDGRQVHFRGLRVEEMLPAIRARAEAMGVTINALAIETQDSGMAAYFRQHVMAGHGAFVLRAATMEDFAAAIVAKLRLELTAGTEADLRMKRRM
jgi:hypothetical protein